MSDANESPLKHLLAAQMAAKARLVALEEAIARVFTADPATRQLFTELVHEGYRQRLDEMLFALEDKDPALAGEIQLIISAGHKEP